MEIIVNEVFKQIKSDPRSSVFTDEQIMQACKQVAATATEQELFSLLQNQDKLCDRCAGCCTNPPKVEIVTHELLRIAKHLNMSPAKLMKKYKISPTGKRFEDGPEDKRLVYYYIQGKPCTFLKEGNVCSIYPIRPAACSGFPALSMISTIMRIDKDQPVDIGKPPNTPSFCHIIPKWHADRAMKLLEKKKSEGVSGLQQL